MSSRGLDKIDEGVVINVIADSFAGERERHTLETLLASRLSDFAILFGKIAAAVLYTWGLTLLMLVFSLVTVNVTAGTGELLLYPPGTLLGAAGLSFLGAILTAGAGVLLCRFARRPRGPRSSGWASR